MNISEWIHESNLIENIDDPIEDGRSQIAWNWFTKQDLTIPNILKLHKRITYKQLGEDAGRFRRCQVWVGGREGSPWLLVPTLVAEWLNYFVNDGKRMDMIGFIRSAHVAFEHIHPFVDGNGRAGRMIMNLQRVKAGLEPLLLKASERHNYYQWFK